MSEEKKSNLSSGKALERLLKVLGDQGGVIGQEARALLEEMGSDLAPSDPDATTNEENDGGN